MSALLEGARPSLLDALRADGELTLEDLLAGVWEGLAVRARVECPWCGGHMEPQYSAQSHPVGGRCQHCRTTLN